MDNNKIRKDFCPTCGKPLSLGDYLELLTTPPEAPFACSKCPKEPKPDGVPQGNGLTAPPGSIGYSPSPTAQTADAADNYNPNYPGRDRPEPPQKPTPGQYKPFIKTTPPANPSPAAPAKRPYC